MDGPETVPPMVHAVAEALRAECRKQYGTDWNYDVSWAFARAAIEVMRAPTKEMLIEGNSAIDQHIDFYNYDSGAGYSVEPQAAYACLNAMIDAALTPSPPSR